MSGSSANWYNPGGMANAENSSINASGNIQQWYSVNPQGFSTDRQTGSYHQISSFTGFVLYEPQTFVENWRFGFSLTRSAFWRPEIETFNLGPSGAGNLRTNYSSRVNFSTLVPALAAAYRPSESLRLGLSLGVGVTDLGQDQTLSQRLIVGTGPATTVSSTLDSLRIAGNTWQLIGSIGGQWELSRKIRLGALIRLPSLRIRGSSGITFQSISDAGAESSDSFFRDDEAYFNYKEPLSVSAGASYHLEKTELELDLRYFSAIAEYDLYRSPASLEVDNISALGTLSESNIPFPTQRYHPKSVFNLALGGNHRLSSMVRIHGGFFTDLSPVSDPNFQSFRKVDLYGFTGGISIESKTLTGALGFAYQLGTTSPFLVENPIQGNEVESKLDIDIFTFLYALTIKL